MSETSQCTVCSLNGVNPCLNGGSCVPLGPLKYACECPENYSGATCENHVVCEVNDCGEKAVCSVKNHRKTCNCPFGYTGNPKIGCTNKKYEACVTGDPHYQTFDGASYDYQGTCPHVVTETCNGSDFRVIVRNFKQREGDKVSFPASFDVFTQGVLISILANGGLLVDNVVKYYPYYIPSVADPKITISKNYYSIEIRDNVNGAIITYRPNVLCVSVPATPQFVGENTLCGLFGNIDGHCGNDFRYKNGTKNFLDDCNQRDSNQAITFADSWVTERVDNCVLGEVDKNNSNCNVEHAQRMCNNIFLAVDGKGPFAECKRLGRKLLDQAFNNCVFDVCHNANLCTILSGFVGVCLNTLPFAELDHWRDDVNCPFECPAHSHYSLKTPSCPLTCSTPLEAPKSCVDGHKEGCKCDTGYYLDSSGEKSKCIPEEECGCVDTCGNYYLPNTNVISDKCDKQYQCTKGSLIINQIQCSENGVCQTTHGHKNCSCLPGFHGDGYNCTDIDECSLNSTLCNVATGNGVCRNTLGSYYCNCNSPWSGKNCEKYQPARHCADLYLFHNIQNNGVYNVSIGAVYDTDSSKINEGIQTEVYCDMESESGGWTLMSAGNLSTEQSFDNYKNGFGDPHKQAVWLGLERLHQLTTQTNTSLRLTLQRCPKGNLTQLTTTCRYARFSVYDSETHYAVNLPNYCQGNETYVYQDGWVDWPINEVGPPFTSSDCNTTTCSKEFHNTGWWFGQSRCGFVNLNGVRPQCEDIANGKYQHYLTWRSEMLKDALLYLRPRDFPNYDPKAPKFHYHYKGKSVLTPPF